MTLDPREEDLPREAPNLKDAIESGTGMPEEAEDAANKQAGRMKRRWAELTDDERLEVEAARQELEADAHEASKRRTHRT